MSLPIDPAALGARRFGCDVTPLKSKRQFKPFVYLNGLGAGVSQKEKPRLSVGPSLLTLTFELAVHIGVLGGFLALTAARILLLLAGFLTTALLLLARLLTGVLVLLARFLGRIIHLGISLVERSWGQRKAPVLGCAGTAVPMG
jgi:hypothetical protein